MHTITLFLSEDKLQNYQYIYSIFRWACAKWEWCQINTFRLAFMLWILVDLEDSCMQILGRFRQVSDIIAWKCSLLEVSVLAQFSCIYLWIHSNLMNIYESIFKLYNHFALFVLTQDFVEKFLCIVFLKCFSLFCSVPQEKETQWNRR